MSREGVLGRVRAALSADKSAVGTVPFAYRRTGVLNRESCVEMPSLKCLLTKKPKKLLPH